MGLSIDRTDFSAAEFDAFSERLSECLTALRTLLNRPGFGEGPTTIGAELEISIVNDDGAESLTRLPLDLRTSH